MLASTLHICQHVKSSKIAGIMYFSYSFHDFSICFGASSQGCLFQQDSLASDGEVVSGAKRRDTVVDDSHVLKGCKSAKYEDIRLR